MNEKVLVTKNEVERLFSISASTINRLVKAGKFPPPIKITAGSKCLWRLATLLDWAEAQDD